MLASENTLHDVTVFRIYSAIFWSDASHTSNGSHVIMQRIPSKHFLFDLVLHSNPISHVRVKPRLHGHAIFACVNAWDIGFK